MLKRDYFLNVLRTNDYVARSASWIFSVFTIINEAPDAWTKDPYPFRLVRTPTGFFYVDPKDRTKLIQIEDGDASRSLLVYNEPVVLHAGDFVNLDREVKVTYGNAFFNWLALVYPFGSKIPYIDKRFSPADIEKKYISKLLKDDPAPGDPIDPDAIYVTDGLLKFNDTVSAVDCLAAICVPSDTERSCQTHPGMYALRNKLIKENAGKLNDPAVIAEINKQLIALDSEWLKGDPSEGFLISKKMRNVVRPRTYMMYGGEAAFGDGLTVDLVVPSLEEGWDMSKLPTIINTSRAGSYKRGKDTQDGGVETKWLRRVSENARVAIDDCHPPLGVPTDITADSAPRYVGFQIITDSGLLKLTPENIGEYIGKTVMRRSPAFCRGLKATICAVCAGPRLAENPTALSTAVADLGSAFMGYSMSAMHGKELVTARFDPARSHI